MVFESLVNPKKAEKKPWKMFFIGLFYSSIAVLLSIWIFRDHASLVMVFLTVMASLYLIYGVLQLEEEKDIKIKEEKLLIKEHGKALSFFVFLFLGFVVSFSLWYVFLPSSLISDVFGVQQQTITEINTKVTGEAIGTTSLVSKIFFNNIKVMIFCLLFSFFYGSGAIFILTWNASVIGTAIGSFVRGSISHGFFPIFSAGLLRYLTHGIPEIIAYFMAGLAGGIISVAVIRHEFGSERFKHILVDSVDLVTVAVFVLFLASLIEVFITPALF